MAIPRLRYLIWVAGLLLLQACQRPVLEDQGFRMGCDCPTLGAGARTVGGDVAPWAGVRGALLATRFQSLEEFKRVVKVEYFVEGDPKDTTSTFGVRLRHCSMGMQVTSILKSGLSQDDLQKAQEKTMDKAGLLVGAPNIIANRRDLQRVYVLARRMNKYYYESDPSFFDLALSAYRHISTPAYALRYAKDTTEKGYLNTFNHIAAQAFATSLFSEELADIVADLHERKNMSELTTGDFSIAQLSDPVTNPVDNYVDMINNEWGQSLGLYLRIKHGIHRTMVWTPERLCAYLNDLQSYFGWAFGVGFYPFRPEDYMVVRFAEKLNWVMKEPPKGLK